LGRGDGTFDPPVSHLSEGNGFGVAVGKLDGDEHLDVVVANYSNKVSVFRGRGDGGFEPRTDWPTGSSCRAVAIADFDGDGIPDIATGNESAHTASVLRGVGDGTFEPRRDFGTDGAPVAIAAADLNGDGRNDLAIANVNAGTITVLLNTSNHPTDVPAPGPSPLALAPPRPNPSRGGLEFEFTLPRSQAVSLTVLDVAGRNVATLVAATLGPGPHRAAWDGRTSSGGLAPAGVYLCELRTEAGRVGRRFVVLP
jgi:hypothetical protein